MLNAIHGNGLRDGAAAAATSWGSGPGLVGGARPPSTAEKITFHAAIRAAVKLEPEQELGTAAPSSPSKYVRSVRSPPRRAPLLATPIAKPLQCGRP